MVDFQIIDQGSVVLFTPVSENARTAAENDFGLESWQWMGNSFAVDHRVAEGLIAQLQDDGYIIR